MDNILSKLCEQAGELNKDLTETALACNEIAGRAWTTLMSEHNEVIDTYLETAGQQLTVLTQTRSPRELLAREAQLLSALAKKLRQSVQEVRGIQRVARAEMALCLEDGWQAMQSRILPSAPPSNAALLGFAQQ